jgi:DNA primase
MKNIFNPLGSSGVLRALSKSSDLVIAGFVVMILMLIIIPVPPEVIDVFIAVSLTVSLTLLMVGLYIQKAVHLSIFPSILLITTLFRLGIEIAATRLIQEGLDLCVATQGTAFAKEHLKLLLKLGVEQVYLAFDGDSAGQKAAATVGDMFQYEGIEVKVLPFTPEEDPDQILLSGGIKAFLKKMEQAKDYLYFLVDYFKQDCDMSSPTQKNRMIQKIVERVRRWQHPLLVHETLRKLARVTRVPEKLVGAKPKTVEKDFVVKNSMRLSQKKESKEEVLEVDLLRWILLMPEDKSGVLSQIFKAIDENFFFSSSCKSLFEKIKARFDQGQSVDLVSLSAFFTNLEDKVFLTKIMEKKINPERAEEGAKETALKMREKYFFIEKEKIHEAMKEEGLDQDQVLELARRYDTLTRTFQTYQWEDSLPEEV